MAELRAPGPGDLPRLTALCLRSKAHWGYDAEFMAACVPALTLTEAHLRANPMRIEVEGATYLGVAMLSFDGGECHLERLFVDPAHMGAGTGRRLFAWARDTARAMGAAGMVIEADPGAVPFYLAMGCHPAGSAPSDAIPGRRLPRLVHDLR